MSAAYDTKQPTSAATIQSEQSENSAPLPKPPARRTGGAPKRNQHAKTMPAATEIEQLLVILDRQLSTIVPRIDGDAGDMEATEIKPMRDALSQERSELMSAVTQLPKGSPLIVKAFEATDNVNRVISRLDALVRARSAGESVREDEHQADRSTAISDAAAQDPDGYCEGANDEVAPCGLPVTKRDKYRREITARVLLASNSWLAAVNALHVEEKLKALTPTFERQVGQLLLSMLFDVVGEVAKGATTKGIDHASKSLVTEIEHEGTFAVTKYGPHPDTTAAMKKGAEKAVSKASPVAQQKVGLTAQQLAASAAPPSRDDFLMTMKSAPTLWANKIVSQLDLLFDDDLAALRNGIPSGDKLTQPAYEERIRADLKRFEEQVQSLSALSPPRLVQVFSQSGQSRYALARPEERSNNALHGEWRGSATPTGKWSFVTWVDDDMKDMALGTAVQRDVTATAATVASTDAGFWDDRSLQAVTAAIGR
jgi:hypothetical protein